MPSDKSAFRRLAFLKLTLLYVVEKVSPDNFALVKFASTKLVAKL